jgi:hypothetical protein
MSFPNVSDIVATTIESRTRAIADNVTNNNVVLKKLEMKGKIKPFSGGSKILQELSYQENSNAGWYQGYDLLPVGVSDVISAAEFDIKQAAVPVVISGLEMLQNAGKERMIDLLESRLSVAESTMANLIVQGLYSDGTDAKAINGLDQSIPEDPTAVGTYGGIDQVAWAFWRNAVGTYDLGAGATGIQGPMNSLWSKLVRGNNRPELILCDNIAWTDYLESLQALQRFTSAETGKLGFPTIKYMDADVALDGGLYFPSRASWVAQGGTAPYGVPAGTGAGSGTQFWLNCDYIHYRPHSARNMVPLSPNRRYATNQDAEVQILAWAGNLTCSGRAFQGRLTRDDT